MSAPARAGNDDEVFLGNQAPLSGGAVTATVNDGAALVYEPSGLVEGEDATIDVSVTALSLRIHNADDVVSTTASPGEDARFVEFVSIPSTLAYTRTLSSRTRFGFGIFATRGSALRIRESVAIPGEGERSAYQFASVQRGSAIVLTAGIGHRITSAWRFGASIGVVYDADDVSTLLSGARYVEAGPVERNTDSITVQNVASFSRFGLRATFGVRFVPNDRFRMALSLTTPGLALAGIVSTSTSSSIFSLRPPEPFSRHDQAASDGVSFKAGMFSPFRISLGFAFRIGRTQIAIDNEYRMQVADEAYGVQRRSVYNVRAGLRHTLSESLTFGAGLFTDRSSYTSANTSMNASGDERHFYGATIGVEHLKVRRLAESETARELRFVSTYGVRYAFAVGDANGVSVDPILDASVPTSIVNTKIRAVTHELSLYIGSSLRF